LKATVDVTTDDGATPPIGDLQTSLARAIPGFLGVVVDVGPAVEITVQ
jgi:hypothetical protein